MADLDTAVLRQRFLKMSDEDLLAVLHSADDYQPQAVDAARGILIERGVDLAHPATQEVFDSLDRDKVAADERNSASLSPWLRAVCALLPGLPALVIIGLSLADGRKQRALEAVQWTFIGIVGHIVLQVACMV